MPIELIPALTTDSPPAIAAGGNTYADLAFATSYFARSSQACGWPADDQVQTQLLDAAMRVVEAQHFIGVRSTTTQPLEWPRLDEQTRAGGVYDLRGRYWPTTLIPTALKQAQCETALAMANDASHNDAALAQTKLGLSGTTIDFHKQPGTLPKAARERLHNLLLQGVGTYR